MEEKILGITIRMSKVAEEGIAILQPKRSPYIHSESDLLARACIIQLG